MSLLIHSFIHSFNQSVGITQSLPFKSSGVVSASLGRVLARQTGEILDGARGALHSQRVHGIGHDLESVHFERVGYCGIAAAAIVCVFTTEGGGMTELGRTHPVAPRGR